MFYLLCSVEHQFAAELVKHEESYLKGEWYSKVVSW